MEKKNVPNAVATQVRYTTVSHCSNMKYKRKDRADENRKRKEERKGSLRKRKEHGERPRPWKERRREEDEGRKGQCMKLFSYCN